MGGSWGPYYQEWPFALVPDENPLYAVVRELGDVAARAARDGRIVTLPTASGTGICARSSGTKRE